MRKDWLKPLAFLGIALLLLSCAPTRVPPPQLATPAAVPPASLASPKQPVLQAEEIPAWQAEWVKVVEAAKKEGKVVLYMASFGPRRGIVEGFKERYGISVETVVARGGELSEKILAQRRAGIYEVDIFIAGAATNVTIMKPAAALDPIDPVLIHPEVLDPKVWWGGSLRWIDKDHYVVASQAAAQQPLITNAEVVKPGEIKSYRDLLNPKWKGKITVDDPTTPGFGSKWVMVMGLEIMGPEYLREFAKQEPVFSRDHRLRADWVAKGKYPIGIAIFPEIVKEFQEAGAPLKYVEPVEGTWLSSSTSAISLMNKAPHPNAAKLLINWLLTKEGATLFSRGIGIPSARLDVSTEGIMPEWLLKPGVKYFIGDSEDFLLKEPAFYKIAMDIFGPLLKK